MYTYICLYIYIHIYIHIYTHACAHVRAWTHTPKQPHAEPSRSLLPWRVARCNAFSPARDTRVIAVCCSLLQFAAACCSVLQRVAVSCSVSQCPGESHVATPFHLHATNALVQCVAVCINVLQCTAVSYTGCNRRVACCSAFSQVSYTHVSAVCCSALRCVTVWCSVLQCVAVYCSVLQCIAVCCNALGSRTLQRLNDKRVDAVCL